MAPRRPGDPAEAVADTTTARTVLGWTPQHSALDTIVTDAWAGRQLIASYGPFEFVEHFLVWTRQGHLLRG